LMRKIVDDEFEKSADHSRGKTPYRTILEEKEFAAQRNQSGKSLKT